jgi:hypothetical protein
MPKIMIAGVGLLIWAVAVHADPPPAAATPSAPAAFDGAWNTVITCAPAPGALPYTYRFSSTVKDGVLHGERGVKGLPGWLALDGRIAPDGSADIRARGLVGKSRYAVGERPTGTPYRYRIDARFTTNSGAGERVNLRSCTASFTRQAP